MAEGGVGRPAVHKISKLAQRDAEHRQETEIISADQLAGAKVGKSAWTRGRELSATSACIPNTSDSMPLAVARALETFLSFLLINITCN